MKRQQLRRVPSRRGPGRNVGEAELLMVLQRRRRVMGENQEPSSSTQTQGVLSCPLSIFIMMYLNVFSLYLLSFDWQLNECLSYIAIVSWYSHFLDVCLIRGCDHVSVRAQASGTVWPSRRRYSLGKRKGQLPCAPEAEAEQGEERLSYQSISTDHQPRKLRGRDASFSLFFLLHVWWTALLFTDSVLLWPIISLHCINAWKHSLGNLLQ